MQPGDVVALKFESGLVALSFVISALGAYVALLAASRIRGADNRAHLGYVAVAAVALGGIGIWGMHFIGMIAQVLPFSIGYSLISTLISLIVAIFFSGAALWFLGSAKFTLKRCVIAGSLAGVGVAAMHYIGMGSMRMDAVFEWNTGLVVASVVIAVVAASAALWLAFNVVDDVPRIGAALIMAVAVCGMHYTGAAAGVIVCTTPRAFSSMQLDGGLLPYAVFLISVITLVVMRVELYRSSKENQLKMASKLEKVLNTR